MRTLAVKDVTLEDGRTVSDLSGEVVEGLESLRQRTVQRLRFFQGTWFADTRRGVPHLTEVLGSNRLLGGVTEVISNTIRDDPEITGVRNVEASIDATTRTLSYRCEATTVYGSMNLEVTVP